MLRQYELDFKKAEDEVQRSRQKNLASVSPDELVDLDEVRFRIVRRVSADISSPIISFVRLKYDIQTDRPSSFRWRLRPVKSEGAGANSLDIFGSEWGRLHEHAGQECRILARVTGRNHGGQFIVRMPEPDTERRFEIDIITSRNDGSEQLSVQMLNMQTGAWQTLPELEVKKIDRDWQRLRLSALYERVGKENRERIDAQLRVTALPEAEILDVKLYAEHTEIYRIAEREPFEIRVRVKFNHPIPMVDVGIKFDSDRTDLCLLAVVRDGRRKC